MTIKEIFDFCLAFGAENDPRGKKKVEKRLKKIKTEYGRLSIEKRREFDEEKLTNPYSDTGILFGDTNKEVKNVLVGIDIDPAEVLLANELSKKGKKIDLIIAHHPIGKSLSSLHEVMDMQTDIWAQEGVPENIAEGVLRERVSQVARRLAPVNHFQPVDTARLLNIPLINIHTPADNCVYNYLYNFLKKKNPETVEEVISALKEIPEYKAASKMNAGPVVFAGSEKSRAGKIVLGMTGGVGSSEKIYERLSHYGIGTVVDMHVGEKHIEEAAKHYINIVIAGHMASDSIGLNILMDELEKKGIGIIPCSGYIRHSRVK